MRELKTVLPYLRPYRWTFAGGLVLVLVSNYFLTLGPKFLELGIDALEQGSPFAEVRRAGLLLIGVALLGGVARYGMREFLNSGSRKVEYRIRNALFQHLQRLSSEFNDRFATGDVMARTTNDLLAVRMVIGPAIMYLVDTITRGALIGPRMLAISPRLTLFALLPLAVLPLAMFVLGRLIHDRSMKVQTQFAALTDHIHENLSGVRVVRAYRQEAAEIAQLGRLNEEYVRRNMGLASVQGAFRPLFTFLGGLSAVVVLAVGGRLVIGGSVSVAAFVAFGVYLAMLIWPLIALGWVVNLVQRGAASMGRINVLFRQHPTVVSPPDPVPLPPATGGRAITFDHVWFRYPNAKGRGWVLQDVSFHVTPGSSLAVVGATGSGKSTLVDLLVRTYDPDKGQILLDGIEVRDLALEELRSAIGFVPQETFLFSQTLRENILLGADGTHQLDRVIETAQLREAIATLPDGLETMLGERGVNLSGGQKQRAAIARALAIDPPVFVLDDALSAVDAHTEAKILAGLRGALAGRTSIVVSHRLAAVRDADWILVLEGGVIVEQGRHEDLIARGGRYWSLLRKQQLEEELEGVRSEE
ncbi:MAG: ABC transporter ATP-binding protein [Gemmatimonadales bacterium]|nr:ABC transporter ATP-binding protein [Gemmatimonadales bacterium]